ncbi:MAG: DUF401 family protein [Candidatus Lokiarchaeota archaeon]|nr:DUF401 family protein [Candidatus Lokiarchaeota archaeon]
MIFFNYAYLVRNVIPSWLTFLLALGIAMILSKKDLGVGLIVGAVFFGIFAEVSLFSSAYHVTISLENLFLAFSVTLIPILGGIMKESNMILELVRDMNISKKTALMFSPALYGLLPIAGGALMSAPLVEEIDPDLHPGKKVAINVWFRHVLVLIYPLQSSLIIASNLAKISLYTVMSLLLIPCVAMILVGYFILIRSVKKKKKENQRNLKVVIRYLFPIILAPIIDAIGRYIISPLVPGLIPEIFMFIGLLVSVILAFSLSTRDYKNIQPLNKGVIKKISKDMSIWKFPLLIYAIFFFFEVFSRSDLPDVIAELNLVFVLLLLIALFLGFATGRVALPVSILIPIYLEQFLLTTMPLFEFTLLYFAIFLGYIFTPIHPCVAYSMNYFKVNFKEVLKYLFLPAAICFVALLAVYGIGWLISIL